MCKQNLAMMDCLQAGYSITRQSVIAIFFLYLWWARFFRLQSGVSITWALKGELNSLVNPLWFRFPSHHLWAWSVSHSSGTKGITFVALIAVWYKYCLNVFFCFIGFLTLSSSTRLYRRQAPRQFYVLPYMRQSWETMTSVSAGHITLTPTQPVGMWPQRESNPGPPHQESRALPTELPRPRVSFNERHFFLTVNMAACLFVWFLKVLVNN